MKAEIVVEQEAVDWSKVHIEADLGNVRAQLGWIKRLINEGTSL